MTGGGRLVIGSGSTFPKRYWQSCRRAILRRWPAAWPWSRFPVLAFADDVLTLVEAYDHRLGLVGRARADLPHSAFAVAYEQDYLVTWNCAHIANGEIIRRLHAANAEPHRSTPVIVTPEELLGVSQGDEP